MAKTHDDIILNNDIDVIVRYYAPFDIRNKRGSEDFYKVADIFASDEELKSKVIFADINMQTNDIASFAIYSYPTIILYPSSNDSTPITLSGSKTPAQILKFLKRNGSHHADGIELYFKSYPAEKEDFDEDDEEKEQRNQNSNPLPDPSREKPVVNQETAVNECDDTSDNQPNNEQLV